MRRTIAALLVGATLLWVPTTATAHVSAASLVSGVPGPGFANTTQEIAFGVGHGCEGADTYSVTVTIPAGVTSVRPLRSDFGKVSLEKNAAGDVTAITWQKADSELHDADISYYRLSVRLRLPNQPFTTLYFPVRQTCKKSDGTVSTVAWAGTATDPGAEPTPAPALRIVPARKPGWNRFTVPAAIPNLSTFFSDAQIVWKGTAAYSSNTATADLIKATSGVTELTALQANDEIWVRY